MSSGIYCIENRINGKKYIGSSDDIDERWKFHKSYLRNNNHSNTHLQRAWNKYGEENFEFRIIEICDLENLEDRENYFIDLYNTINDDFGYNKKWAFGRKKNGTERSKKPMLQSVKEKISKAMSGIPKSEEWKSKVRKPKPDGFNNIISEMKINKKLNIKRTSDYIGVYYIKKLKKWAAFIRINKDKVHLGVFKNEIDAAKAFDKKYCGLYNTEFGLNFPK